MYIGTYRPNEVLTNLLFHHSFLLQESFFLFNLCKFLKNFKENEEYVKVVAAVLSNSLNFSVL